MEPAAKTTRWYVITGAPSSGITTLACALKPYADRVFPEIARAYLDRGIKRGRTVAELRKDEAAFQKEVLMLKLGRERRARRDKLYIFERGVPDSIAYFKITGLDAGTVKADIFRYRKVFYLDPLEYHRDYARTETNEIRDELSRLLFSSYSDLGYEVIRVPAVSVEERVRMVLSHLEGSAAAALG